MIFPLLHDFTAALAALPAEHPRHRILALIDEALRRDVHFIARHPTTLFQCLWNTCWWYDCPEAAERYELLEGGRGGPAPWEYEGPKLCELLERWREAKRDWAPGFNWLRSLRPPPAALGSAIKVVLDARSAVTGLAFSPTGIQIAAASYHYTVRIWDVETGFERHCLSGHEYGELRVAFAPDGRQVATGSDNGTIRLWDALAGTEIRRMPGPSSPCLAFSPDSRRLAGASEFMALWDTLSGAQLHRFLGHEKSVQCVAFSPDGRHIVSGSADTTVRVWDAVQGGEVQCLRGHEKIVVGVAVDDEGRRIISASSDGTVRIWDFASGRPLRCFPCPVGAYPLSGPQMALAPRGRQFVIRAADGTAQVWDLESGRELRRFYGYEHSVLCVAFSPDGRYVAGGSTDCTVLIWELERESGYRLLKGCEALGGQFSKDGRYLMSWGGKGKTIVWDAQDGRCLWIGDPKDAPKVPVGDRASRGPVDAAYQCVTDDKEATVQSLQNGGPVAWYPRQPHSTVATHPSGRIWLVEPQNSTYLHLFTMEEG